MTRYNHLWNVGVGAMIAAAGLVLIAFAIPLLRSPPVPLAVQLGRDRLIPAVYRDPQPIVVRTERFFDEGPIDQERAIGLQMLRDAFAAVAAPKAPPVAEKRPVVTAAPAPAQKTRTEDVCARHGLRRVQEDRWRWRCRPL